MSGGVDSSVAAALLVEQGYDVCGAYMKNWINEENIIGNCPWQQDIEDARAVAEQLGIEFQVVNLIRDYRERIVQYLLDGYRAGITPNPDVMCNREMKFGVFLDYARDQGFDAVATGHYAQLRNNADGRCDILQGADGNKDQSYFLAMLRQQQAAGALFPIGGIAKPEVRRLAEERNLINHAKKDSQGICFIGEIKMADFLRTYVADNVGPVVDLSGKVLGEHRGLHLYTLGQRRGIGVASPVSRQPYVVIAKRPQDNALVIGFDKPDTPGLYASRCRVGNVSYINRSIETTTTLLAKPRYRAPSMPVTVTPQKDGSLTVRFHDRQRALAPGQICAFYDNNVLLGGGVFEEIFAEDGK